MIRSYWGSGVYSWKSPIWLAAGHRVRVSVPHAERHRARLVFTQPSDRKWAQADRRVNVTACAKGDGTAWAAGILTRRKRLCLRLVVTDLVSGARFDLRLPLQRRCPASR